VASSHSDWFLDSVFEAMGVTHWLPAAYQLILLPARVLYAVVGKDAYIRLFEHVDSLIDIAHFGTHHGAQFAVTVATLCAALVALSPQDSHQGFTQVSISLSAFSGAKLPSTLELRTGPTC
jgi:hypothetical protein